MILGITDEHAFGYYPYYKLIYYKVLPETLGKVLVLDTDLLIRGDITPLFDVDLKGFALAGCIEHLGSNERAFESSVIDRYHLDIDEPYYNTGVMVMHLLQLRIEDPADKMLNIALREHFPHADQDMFNMYFSHRILTLPKRYNHQPYAWVRNKEQVNPVIVHFIGKTKPTDYRYIGKFFWAYQRYNRAENMITFSMKHIGYAVPRRIWWCLRKIR